MKSKILIFVIFSTFFILSSAAYPQTPGMRHWREEPRSWRASELKLSPEQAKGLDLIDQTYLRETQLLRAQVYVKWLELREFLTDPSAKMESIRLKQGEMVEIQQRLEEKTFQYLMQVRNLLNQEQLKSWDPEQELPLLWKRMHGPGPMRRMHSLPPKERSREE
jgi:hypothetical protein